MRRGDHGPLVRQVQADLAQLGYALPRSTRPDGTLDGDCGLETLGIAALWLAANAGVAPVDGNSCELTDDELLAISSAATALRNGHAQTVGTQGPPGTMYVDRRSSAAQTHFYGNRSWGQVRGITLHQTACVLGETPKRWDTVGCHVGITRTGQVIQLHDFTKLIVHGHGWNTQCVGIEMDGEYAGIEGDIRTFWRPPDEPNRLPQTPTTALIEAAKATIRWIVAEVARNGGKLTKLVAHRQASSERESDPGSALWRAVALPMHAELGLDDGGVGFTIGDGLPVPAEWDERCSGIPYR